jgi:hypothetical protein
VRSQISLHTNFKNYDTCCQSAKKKNERIGRVVKKKRMLTLYKNSNNIKSIEFSFFHNSLIFFTLTLDVKVFEINMKMSL